MLSSQWIDSLYVLHCCIPPSKCCDSASKKEQSRCRRRQNAEGRFIRDLARKEVDSRKKRLAVLQGKCCREVIEDKSSQRFPLAKGGSKQLKNLYAMHTLWGSEFRRNEFLRRMRSPARAQLSKLRAGGPTNCQVLWKLWYATLRAV